MLEMRSEVHWYKIMAPCSSTLTWKIPRTEEPGGLQSMGSLRVRHDFTFTFTFHFRALEKEMATHSSVLAWRIPGMEEQPGGLPSMGSHRVRHDWSDLAAVAAAYMSVFLPFLSLTSFFFLLSSLLIWKWKLLSRVWLFGTPWAIQSMEFFRPELLEWVVVPFSRGSSQPRDWSQVSRIAGGFFTSWATREAQEYWSG